jgi:hypothetical protein
MPANSIRRLAPTANAPLTCLEFAIYDKFVFLRSLYRDSAMDGWATLWTKRLNRTSAQATWDAWRAKGWVSIAA